MKYAITTHKGKTVLKIQENIVTDPAAREFKEILSSIIDEGKNEIIIDFSEMLFIGSSGIGKLLLAYKRLAEKNGKIYLVGLNKDIKDLFITFRLNEFFQIEDSLKDID
ncbi:MAG: STAS domain-containing protein [Brevinematales bacterium]|nr:STAS domain-containing protein [Brevinematales bacterium]